MEKLAELKSKLLKFLPRQPVASIQKPNLSPSRSVAGNRSPCHIVSIFPKEARRKLRNSSFSAREPSSPKVSCMGEVDQLMKKKKKGKKKKTKARDHQSTGKAVKKEKMLLWIFKGSDDQCEISPRKGGEALDLEVAEKAKAQRHAQNAPSLATMKKFPSGRGTLSDFDVKLAQLSSG
ncbi:uncharacterized protein At1g76070-like [Prosopis cineraria]|uniref:uncharacterized protein At1g76070-like n=1 Tax=Prosopis cineraria TaxID=364024 RepID=UPI00240F7AD4|nr:uncharacterized protein At1g76070-like [Prosopis cineraria]